MWLKSHDPLPTTLLESIPPETRSISSLSRNPPVRSLLRLVRHPSRLRSGASRLGLKPLRLIVKFPVKFPEK